MLILDTDTITAAVVLIVRYWDRCSIDTAITILEPGIGQFREFEPPRVHTRINSWGFFLVHKLTCGKRESVSLATLDEKSTSSGIAEPYAR